MTSRRGQIPVCHPGRPYKRKRPWGESSLSQGLKEIQLPSNSTAACDERREQPVVVASGLGLFSTVEQLDAVRRPVRSLLWTHETGIERIVQEVAYGS